MPASHNINHTAEIVMIHRNADDRKEAIEALTLRYVLGELSEPTFVVSLHAHIDVDEIRHIVTLNQLAHRSRSAYRRGDVR